MNVSVSICMYVSMWHYYLSILSYKKIFFLSWIMCIICIFHGVSLSETTRMKRFYYISRKYRERGGERERARKFSYEISMGVCNFMPFWLNWMNRKTIHPMDYAVNRHFSCCSCIHFHSDECMIFFRLNYQPYSRCFSIHFVTVVRYWCEFSPLLHDK